jgi:dCMP deaminase
MKRLDYISWDEYFMGVAKLSAQRSKDPSTQVGACIVNKKNRIVGIGYNGFPVGIDDDLFPWNQTDKWLESKYPYVVHAEQNAILNATEPLDYAKIYVTLFPCNECAKVIIQSGIREVIYLEDKYHDQDIFVASRRLLDASGVKYRKMNPINLVIER